MKLNPYFAIILAVTMGGFGGVLVKLLNLPATSITFFRLSIPVIVLLIYLKLKDIELFRGNYKIMLFASLLNAIRMFLFYFAFVYTTIGNAILLFYTWPIFATIFGIILLKEKAEIRTLMLIGVALIGIILMYANKEINFASKDFLGMGAMVLCALLFSLSLVIFKKGLDNYSKTETIFYQNLLGAIIFLPFILINRPVPTLTQITIASSFFGVLMGLVAFGLLFYAMKNMKMSHYSLFNYWEIISAVTLSIIFFDEAITINMIFGGILIIISGLLLKKEKSEMKDKKDL